MASPVTITKLLEKLLEQPSHSPSEALKPITPEFLGQGWGWAGALDLSVAPHLSLTCSQS